MFGGAAEFELGPFSEKGWKNVVKVSTKQVAQKN